MRSMISWLCRLLALLIALWVPAAMAQTPAKAPAPSTFDHLSTGFALQDAHARATCESCHQGGVLKGTPRDCASCHTAGRRLSAANTVMPPTHLPTRQACDSCHNSATFVGAKFRHVGVLPGSCATCHNGAVTAGKTSNHVPTTAACDSCHRSTSWLPALAFDHAGVVPGSCQTCHNGSRATGKPPQHMPTGTAIGCDSCHKSTRAWSPTAWNHTQTVVAAQCAGCHSGGYPPADGKPANHVPYQAVPAAASANCDSCHRAGFANWTPASVHASLSLNSSCATCHNGNYAGATGKPGNATHAAVTGNCESCHKSTGSWGSAKVDHATFTAATNCAGCHNGSSATGKPPTHMPTGSATCFSCHGTTGWTPTKWNHTQVPVTAQCASCHNGGYPPADGKPANHIPYVAVPVTAAANCDGCHKGSTSTWAGARLHTNYAISTSCASCHNGSYPDATGKPANALHATVTGNCESCHKSTTSWSSAKVDHSTFTAATNCVGCHNGSTATGKPGTHIPTGAATCYSCHGTTGWTPTKWNHTQVPVTAQCASCHNGGYPPADGKPANHIPYAAVPVTAAANCDGCHKGSTSTWANGRLHASYSVSTGCSTCHSGAYLGASGKPANAIHASVTGNCESCHKSTASWSVVNFAHSPANAVGTGTCDGCHNGSTATGKPPTHIPVPAGAARCDSCHRSQSSWTASMTMNHTVVASGSCKSCHGGGFTGAGATPKPANHIPEVQLLAGATMDCSACHTATTSWGSMRMNHNNSQGNGAGWCKACHDRSTAWLGDMEKKSLTHEKSTGVTDCSQSGCHRPLGNKGAAYTKWD
jgi:hypothetical protein